MFFGSVDVLGCFLIFVVGCCRCLSFSTRFRNYSDDSGSKKQPSWLGHFFDDFGTINKQQMQYKQPKTHTNATILHGLAIQSPEASPKHENGVSTLWYQLCGRCEGFSCTGLFHPRARWDKGPVAGKKIVSSSCDPGQGPSPGPGLGPGPGSGLGPGPGSPGPQPGPWPWSKCSSGPGPGRVPRDTAPDPALARARPGPWPWPGPWRGSWPRPGPGPSSSSRTSLFGRARRLIIEGYWRRWQNISQTF